MKRSMPRMLLVAVSEFQSLVKTKAFLVGVILMPVIMGGFIAFQIYAQRHLDREERVFAVVDQTGVLFGPLTEAAAEFNRQSGAGASQTGPRFLPQEAPLDGRPLDDVKIELSQRVRRKELFAFVQIPASVLTDPSSRSPIEYYTQTPSYERLPNWLGRTLSTEVTKHRFSQVGVDPAVVVKLNRPVDLTRLGLLDRKADGTVTAAQEVDRAATFFVPFAYLVLMFLAVMTASQQMLGAVIEEKVSRISEVLISSITPSELLAGKLLGVTAVSVLLTLIYFFGGAYAAFTSDHWEWLNPRVMAWFVVFLVCAVLMFGSMFLAIGSACSDMKDAQSMMQPAMILMLIPYLASFVVLRAPDSGFAVALSMVPTCAPFVMTMRLALEPGPPAWQLWASMALTLATAVLFVWAAARIFRVGLLMQGKAPNLPEMLRWIRQSA